MFANYELEAHRLVEAGEPITADVAQRARTTACCRHFHGDAIDYDDLLARDLGAHPALLRLAVLRLSVRHLLRVERAPAAGPARCATRGRAADASTAISTCSRSGSSDHPMALLQRAGIDSRAIPNRRAPSSGTLDDARGPARRRALGRPRAFSEQSLHASQTCRPHHRGRRGDRPRPDHPARRRRPRTHRHARPDPLDPALGTLVTPRVHRVDPRPRAARAHPRRVRDRPGVPPRGAAVDALRVHAGDGAPGQRRRHAAPARVRAEGRGVARPSGRLRLSLVDRRLRPARRRDARARRARSARTTATSRRRCTAATSCTASCSARYYARHYKQLAAAPLPAASTSAQSAFPGPDLGADRALGRHVRLRARDDSRRGAAARRIDCFVRPDTRIPFMAMPDGVEALLAARRRPARAADAARRTTSRAFNPSADEIRAVVLRGVSRRRDRPRGRHASGRASSTPGPRTSTTRRRDATGASSRGSTSTAAFEDYLIPTIRRRYRTAAGVSPRGPTAAVTDAGRGFAG